MRVLSVVLAVFISITLSACGKDFNPIGPNPVDQTFSVRGTVYETFPTLNTPVPSAKVEVLEGLQAGKFVIADNFGAYTISELSGVVVLRATKDGYEQDLKGNISSTTSGVVFSLHPVTPWPVEVLSILSKLSMPDGLRYREVPNSAPSYYNPQYRTVVYVSSAPTGKAAAVAHELGHAHQNRAILDIGLEPKDMTITWPQTPEGKDYLELTGWQVGQPEPPCERWGCGYPNALEDNATLCASWFLNGPEWVRIYAPKRYQWAQRWLPR